MWWLDRQPGGFEGIVLHPRRAFCDALLRAHEETPFSTGFTREFATVDGSAGPTGV
jgi:hypothetical protein